MPVVWIFLHKEGLLWKKKLPVFDVNVFRMFQSVEKSHLDKMPGHMCVYESGPKNWNPYNLGMPRAIKLKFITQFVRSMLNIFSKFHWNIGSCFLFTRFWIFSKMHASSYHFWAIRLNTSTQTDYYHPMILIKFEENRSNRLTFIRLLIFFNFKEND